MPILLLAHPYLAQQLRLQELTCIQNTQDAQRWFASHPFGIVILDLDAFPANDWDFLLPDYTYIGLSHHITLLEQAQKQGLDIAIHKSLPFDKHLYLAIENAQKMLTLKKENSQLQVALCKTRTEQDMSLLLGGISHDFSNILSIVLGSAKILQQENNDAATQELLQTIIDAGKHGKDLTKQLMQYQNQSIAQCDIEAVLQNVGGLIKKSLPPNIHLHISPTSSTQAKISATELIRILMNLIVNARDAMPKGGHISIQTENISGFIQITVQDSGIGMTEDIRSKIFDPFFTTKKEHGSGLGLTGVYNIITQKNGRIRCKSEPEKGTCFVIELPLFKNPQVFILDTDFHRAEQLQKLLESQGDTSVLCQNLADLIQETQRTHLGCIIVSEHFSQTFPFDLFTQQYLILCGNQQKDSLWNTILPESSSAETILDAIPLS